MFRLLFGAMLLGLSSSASADPVVLRCTFSTGSYAGQSASMAFSEEQGLVLWGQRVQATFSAYAIEWSAADGKAKFKLDRVNGDLYIQVRQAPFALVGNCIVAPTETRF